jgi:hypothetical protein
MSGAGFGAGWSIRCGLVNPVQAGQFGMSWLIGKTWPIVNRLARQAVT